MNKLGIDHICQNSTSASDLPGVRLTRLWLNYISTKYPWHLVPNWSRDFCVFLLYRIYKNLLCTLLAELSESLLTLCCQIAQLFFLQTHPVLLLLNNLKGNMSEKEVTTNATQQFPTEMFPEFQKYRVGFIL